jgi:dihydroneopterin aldolase/2-amino-4-hydroxy-6-hydroxymethyldihydropteridine diphosphokinase
VHVDARGAQAGRAAPSPRLCAASSARNATTRAEAMSLLGGAAHGERAAGDGRRQCDARFVLRRWGLVRRDAAVAHGRIAVRREPLSSTSGVSPPVRARLRPDETEEVAPGRAGGRRPRRRGRRGVGRHHARRGCRRRHRGRRRHRQRRLRGASPTRRWRPSSRPRNRLRRHALARAQRRSCRAAPTTTTSPDVCRELAARLDALTAPGSPGADRPRSGLGFAKNAEHNWALLRGCPRWWRWGTGCWSAPPASASSAWSAAPRRPPAADERDTATAVTSAYAADAGVWALRVHDVRATVDALDVRAAWRALDSRRECPVTAATGANGSPDLRATGFTASSTSRSATARSSSSTSSSAPTCGRPAPVTTSPTRSTTANSPRLAIARVTGPAFDLIEALAEAIAADTLPPRIEAVAVTVHKPAPPIARTFADVSVTVCRTRSIPIRDRARQQPRRPRPHPGAAIRELRDRGGVRSTRSRRLSRPTRWVARAGGLPQRRRSWAHRADRPRLLAELHRIEARHGRIRTVRWGERTLDLDLIQYGTPAAPTSCRATTPRCWCPHPRAAERAFVVLPWLAADPTARIRVGDSVIPLQEHAATLDSRGVRPSAEVIDGTR